MAFTPITRSTRSVSATNLQLNSQFHKWWSNVICLSAIHVLNIMSTLSFQRPSLLYTPPDLGSPSQKSSAADVAIGTLISFSPWDKEGKEGGGGSAPSPATPVSNSHQSQLFGIGLLWIVLMEMDSSAHGHHLWLCLFLSPFFHCFPFIHVT